MVELTIVMDGISSSPLRDSMMERITAALELVPEAEAMYASKNVDGAFALLRKQYTSAHTELNTPKKMKELDPDEADDLKSFADTLGHAVMVLDLFDTNGSATPVAA